MVKKKRSQEDAEQKILKKLAKKGPSHMYPFHEASSEDYIASRMTIHRAKNSLFEQKFIELKRVEPHPGKDKKIYGLTFKGILYALSMGYVDPSKGYEVRIKNKVHLPGTVEQNQLAKMLVSNVRLQKRLFAEQLNKDIIDFVLRMERENSKQIYSFLMKHINLKFYNENDTAQMLLLAELRMGSKIRRIMRSYKSLRKLEKACTPTAFRMVQEIFKSNRNKRLFKRGFKKK